MVEKCLTHSQVEKNVVRIFGRNVRSTITGEREGGGGGGSGKMAKGSVGGKDCINLVIKCSLFVSFVLLL